jgi:cold shock CspA family protein
MPRINNNSELSIHIDSIDNLYKSLNADNELTNHALLMMKLRNWITEVSSFDPVSGQSQSTGVIDFLHNVDKSLQFEDIQGETKDRIYRIVSHTKKAVLDIIEHPRDKILREHAMLPIHAAREVDSNSVQWLSRQPGRTLREKLSGKPYIKAVRRISSIDTSENRLLKVFLIRLEQILIERQNSLPLATEVTCEELLVSLKRWFRSEEVTEIGIWGNLPPNNTLLQDKRYRKIWHGWLWLQAVDENIMGDSKRIHSDVFSMIYWETLSLLNHTSRFRTIQQPVDLDYDNFAISPESPICGYLFPERDSKIKGKIKNINYEKNFGFITCETGTDLFFHKNNLFSKLKINSLNVGDSVSFTTGSNQHGKSAENITLTPDIVSVASSLSGNKFDINIGEQKFSIRLESDHLTLIRKFQGIKKKFQLTPKAINDIPKTVLSMISNTPFEFIQNDEKDTMMRMDFSVVDLCSVRPKFINNNGSQDKIPFRLIQQTWKKKDGTYQILDCGIAKAISLCPDIETVSMRTLFEDSSALSDSAKSSASMFFTKKLSDYIKADKLAYLIPDWGNVFELENIRKSINFYFEESMPLPKSIAAIFAWQSSEKFLRYKVRENDFVLVVDTFDGGVSITPVQAIYQKGLNTIISDTHGLTWERHPTFIVENRNIHTGMIRNLAEDGCQTPEELIKLFGFDGLTSDSGVISFVNGDNWYHLPGSIWNTLIQGLDVNILSNYTIRNSLNSTNKDCSGVNVFILPLEDTIKKPKSLKNYNWLGSAWSPIKGCQTLNEWQKGVEDIALWRDHLPELSIKVRSDKGYADNFYLVKDATVTPERGKTVYIPVEESFTLLAGQSHYSFPLMQGEGSKELQFVAYLKSPAFPLKEDTVCKLKMTYTYGADDPYELKFIPFDATSSDFKSIRVEWRSASEASFIDIAKLPVPDFPARKSWSDFQKYPNVMGKPANLMANIENEISWLDSIIKYARVTAEISSDWKTNAKGNRFCFTNDDTYLSEFSFDLLNGQELPKYGDSVSFYKIESRGKFQGRNVTLTDKNPRKLFSPKFYFSLFTVWNQGHYLSESDVPEHFRNAIFEGTQKALSIIETENVPDTLKEELFFFLSCLHKDAPGVVATRLLDAVIDKSLLRRYSRNIAFAIGNAGLPWQKELLKSVINPIDNEGKARPTAIEILSIALWRSKELINIFTEEEIETLIQSLYSPLKLDIQKVENDGSNYQILTLCKHLELLLALLRSRGNEDEKFKMILAPEKELIKRYVTLVDDVLRIVIDNDIELKSRINLQIDKPEMFRNTPDILYALRMYLTGDSGANTIIITSVSDEG